MERPGAYKQEFIEFMVESDVLKFGDFTLKSDRRSPFFMNAGAYVTARSSTAWASSTPAPSTTRSAWTSTWCSARRTRASCFP